MADKSDEEKNPFKVAMEADKKAGSRQNLLHQKLAAKEQEVQQISGKLRAADRQIKSLTSQLSEQKQAYREVAAQLEDLKEKQDSAVTNKSSQTEHAAADLDSVPPTSGSVDTAELLNRHESLAVKLLQGGLDNLDGATIAAAAAGLRDTAVLETQLSRARTENERWQKEIQHLNDTVFSKTFKPPSAWADREVKYKMEKDSREVEIQALKERLKSLQDENEGYRAANRAAEFEQTVQRLEAEIKKSDEQKVLAQQALHELQLEMRELSVRAANNALQPIEGRDSNVSSRVSRMEDLGVGAAAPSPSKVNGILAHHSRRNSDVAAATTQKALQAMDDQRLGLGGRKKSQLAPDARAGEVSDILSSSEIDVDALVEDFDTRAMTAGKGYQPRNVLPEDDGAAADRAVRETTQTSRDGPEHRDELAQDASNSERQQDSHAPPGTVSDAVLARGDNVPLGPPAPQPRGSNSQAVADVKHSDTMLDAQAPLGTVTDAVLAHPEALDVPDFTPKTSREPLANRGSVTADVSHANVLPEAQGRDGAVAEAVLSHPEGMPSRSAGPQLAEQSIVDGAVKAEDSTSDEIHPQLDPPGLHDHNSQEKVLPPYTSAATAPAKGLSTEAVQSARGEETSTSKADALAGSGQEDIGAGEFPHQGSDGAAPAANSSGDFRNGREAVEVKQINSSSSQSAPKGSLETPDVVAAGDDSPQNRSRSSGEAFEGDVITTETSLEALVKPQHPAQQADKAQPASLPTDEIQPHTDSAGVPTDLAGHSKPLFTANSSTDRVVSGMDAGSRPPSPFDPEEVAAESSHASPRSPTAVAQQSVSAQEDTTVSRNAQPGADGLNEQGEDDSAVDPGTKLAEDLSEIRTSRGDAEINLRDVGHLSITPTRTPDPSVRASQDSAVIARGPSLDSELAQNRALMAQASRQADETLIKKVDGGTDSPWTQEKRQALEAQMEATEAELQEHMMDQDVATLRRRTVEMATRIETHESQIQKMQRSLELADQEKAKLEEDLSVAMQAAQRRGVSAEEDLDAIRGRMRNAAQQADEQSKELETALQDAHRENARLEKAYNELRKQLTSIATKLGSGMIPDDSDLRLESFKEEDEGGAKGNPRTLERNRSSRNGRGSGNFANLVGALSDEDIEVMNLREENARMMDTLVLTKVQLAETQGDYLKMRRGLIRAVEKQAAQEEVLNVLESAAEAGNLLQVQQALKYHKIGMKESLGGEVESLGERTVY